MIVEDLFKIPPYGIKQSDKDKIITPILLNLLKEHSECCSSYRNILDKLEFISSSVTTLSDLPFIPVRLFKDYDLLSVPKEKVIKVLTSSGTSSQKLSKIYLDALNASNQTKTLNYIISSFIGKKRLPLLLLDSPLVKKDRSLYSARGAGIIGFSLFGRDTEFALNNDMELEIEKIEKFFLKHSDQVILMFGYTYMIWKFIVKVLEKKNIFFNKNNLILFHIGGWKKLHDEAVDFHEFNNRVKSVLGNVKIFNYYGMAEQLGSVFVQCEFGHFHCSNFSDVIIRKTNNFEVAKIGEKGVIELLSVLPSSYPGNIILTEDEGEILGVDDCPCGRKGKYFNIRGRIKNAELRGCSDTYEQN